MKNKIINKKLIKVLIPGLVFLVVLFSLLFISNNSKVINSLAKLFYEEVELDNWDISTVIYDSTVNNGQTPLTEINWDETGTSYKDNVQRNITVQIDYKNTNTVRNYAPGELVISMDSLLKGEKLTNISIWGMSGSHNHNDSLLAAKVDISANYSGHNGYEWNVGTSKYFSNATGNNSLGAIQSSTYYFFNKNNIPSNSSIEGHISIIYTIASTAESESSVKYIDSCEHNVNTSTRAVLNNTLSSNTINFNLYRTYNHPWQEPEFEVQQEHLTINDNRLDSDGPYNYVDNIDDYYWVKYDIYGKLLGNPSPSSSGYLYKNVRLKMKSEFCEECVVIKNKAYATNNYDFETSLSVKDDDGYHSIDSKYNSSGLSLTGNVVSDGYFIVGYPKSIYNENNNNLIINNTVKLYSLVDNLPIDSEYTFIAENEKEINLADYNYVRNTENQNLLNFFKSNGSGNCYYESLIGYDTEIGNKGDPRYDTYVETKYEGEKYNVKLGTDYISITDQNSNHRLLTDDEYYFSKIVISTSLLRNAKDSEKAELWVRYANSSDYELYEDITDNFENLTAYTKEFSSTRKVVGFYLLIKGLNASLDTMCGNCGFMQSSIVINSANIDTIKPNNGDFINYHYMEITNSQSGELINNVSESVYNNYKYNIKDLDLENYGHYLQRKTTTYNYNLYSPIPVKQMVEVYPNNRSTSFSNNASDRLFSKTFDYRVTLRSSTNTHDFTQYFDTLQKNYIHELDFYQLLPEGMILSSSPEEIIKSFSTTTCNSSLYDYNGELFDCLDFLSHIKDNTNITIINNYNNTNRTYLEIKIDFTNRPFLVVDENHVFNFNVKENVPYSSYYLYGKNWYTRMYFNYGIDENSSYYYYYDNGGVFTIHNDDGHGFTQESDIDRDNKTNEKIGSSNNFNSIVAALASYTELKVEAKTDSSIFAGDKINVSNGDNYYYKLQFKSDNDNIKNLVLYDSLENYIRKSNGDYIKTGSESDYWQGELLDIDTSFAESQGYHVKVYYSELEKPGSLNADNSWQEYNDSVNKLSIKSLAFEYLDSDNNPVVFSSDSITYVLIKLRSPSDSLTSLAYNGCWVEWNAINNSTGIVSDEITRINSNIVRVALPSSLDSDNIEMVLTKKWNDNSNSLNKRPNSVTYQLIANNNFDNTTEVSFSGSGDTWNTTVVVPKYDLDGNLIDYSLKEEEIVLNDGYKYTPSIEDNTITNTLTKEIELKKIWKDNTNSYLTRPNSVTYNVKQNGNNYKEVTFTGTYNTNQWTKTITVPVYDSSNREYNYSIEEVNINNYSSNCEGFVCTNTLTGKDNINVNKEWIDNNNTYDTRPESITIHLLRNNDQYLDVILNQENNWNSDVEVDKYDSNGVKYNYTIAEDVIDEYGLVSYNQSSYKVTNTLKANTLLTITKQWVDDNNSNNTRPDELKITLLQNNNEYQELTLTGNSNTWTTTIEVPKYDNNQNKYNYSIREKTDNLNSDYSNITYSEEDLTVTNTLNRNMDLVIKKKWKDSDNKYFTRPENISINIYQDDELYKNVQLSGESNIWETVVRDVPVYSSNGKKYLYTIKEANTIEKYKNITYDQTNYVITNELTEIPTVTLYFTVVNGYIDPKTGEMKYDEFGLNEILKKYNVSPDDEYIFNFEIENVDTHKIYDGKLSTKFVLEFKDIPYGKYKVKVGKDKLFEFVDMFSIEDVNGVSFKKLNNEMYISIEPTGDNIIYGAKIVNKINLPIENPKTGINIVITIVVLLALAIVSNRIVKKVLNKA